MPASTGLRIVFGEHLDGQRGSAPANCLGELRVGPLGLLGVLETHLGLLREHPSHAERIVQYRDCLRKSDGPDRFFHASFETDALGTAQTLLEWRDSWYLHGWDGVAPAGAPPRIHDMAQVEAHARSLVGPSIGERLAQVAEAMQRRAPPIESLLLIEPLQALPARWQDVLARLPIRTAEPITPSGTGFLGALQRQLMTAAGGRPAEKSRWIDDGTVRVAGGQTVGLAADWLARLLGETGPQSGSTLLVAPAEGARLDGALCSAGRPRHGLREASAFRPTLQVLPLALEILWEPLNFYGLVQFLTHPVCPLPGYARWRLAAKIADRPGIGGAKWDDVLAEIDEHYGDRAAGVRDSIRSWIEHERFADSGAPIEAVLERVEQVAKYFHARLGDTDATRAHAHYAGYAQSRTCAQALRAMAEQGVYTIRPRQLQILVAQATARGCDNPLHVAEVGAQPTVTHPGAVSEAADEVTWWQLSMPWLPEPYPWARTELEALAQMGVRLPRLEDRLARIAAEWLAPVLAARKRLVLVLPPEGQELHPLWQMIQALFEAPKIERLEDLLSRPSTETITIAHRPLPTRERWWKLPTGVQVPMRERESYSSLELFVFNPYRWLLAYPAKLRSSNLITMSPDFRLLGNLAHELVNRLFAEPDALALPEQALAAWFGGAFEQVVREEGAVLRMPGRGPDLENFRYRLRVAVKELRRQLALAHTASVESEKWLEGSFAGGALGGFADLLVQSSASRAAMVDMKWWGRKKYTQVLRENRQLQLAIYAELQRQQTGAWPAVAYYILGESCLLAPVDSHFPGADAAPSGDGENTAQVWQRFLASWKWRKAQIDAGQIEVVAEDIAETPESSPPEDGLVPTELNDDYNDFRKLAGWNPV